MEAIRVQLDGPSILSAVTGEASTELTQAVTDALRKMRRWNWTPVDLVSLGLLFDRMEEIWGVSPSAIESWCDQTFGGKQGMTHCVALLAACTVDQAGGIWWAKEATSKRFPSLVFDKRHPCLLMDGPDCKVTFTRKGALVEGGLIPYHPFLRQYSLDVNGGFLDTLLKTRLDVSKAERFGIAIDRDLSLDTRYQLGLTTKEYLRGPIGLAREILESPTFPDNPNGTITEHMRGNIDVWEQITGLDIDRLQVMWSCRDRIKSMQMEELVPLTARAFSNDAYVLNRYVHSQWSIDEACFIHLDGAVRLYPKERYASRLETDLLHQREADVAAACYCKLFRIDAPLDLYAWNYLVASFYKHNELALEYLGGAAEFETQE